MRSELDALLEHSKLWDRKVKGLQVTHAKEHTLELRVLISAADSSAVWDLRCEVREGLVDFLQQNYPQSLPCTRTEWRPANCKIEDVNQENGHKNQRTDRAN